MLIDPRYLLVIVLLNVFHSLSFNPLQLGFYIDENGIQVAMPISSINKNATPFRFRTASAGEKAQGCDATM